MIDWGKIINDSMANMHYLVFLVMVMVMAGILKEHNLFIDVFQFILKRVKNKKIVLALISMVGGVLPIQGRVTVSAGILSTIAPAGNTPHQKAARENFGIIDYLATHHYYLWSPLEKTVILPMAALGIGWTGFMGYTLPLLVISLVYILYFISWKIKDEDIDIKVTNSVFSTKRLIVNFAPFILALSATIYLEIYIKGWKGTWLIFTALAIYYILLTKTFNWKKILSYVNWPMVAFLGVIIFLSSLTNTYHKPLEKFLIDNAALSMGSLQGFLTISALAFAISWFLGSSGKFAGILSILITIYGPHYLVWFFVLEFAGYNFSPMHKCVPIGKMYFSTRLSTYASAICSWMLLLVIYAAIVTFAV